VLTALDAADALGLAVALSAALAEVLRGRVEAWHPAFALHRPHPGQARVQAALRAGVAGSDRVDRQPIAATILPTGASRGPLSGRRIGQDAYTLRCVPQILGAVADTLEWHDRVVTTEFHAVTDNPIFPDISAADPDAPPALHGGNFMGQHVGLVSDALSTAVIVMAGLAERQIARLTDERLNDGLPAFLHRGTPGLNSGLMGAQVAATALLAELRAGGGAASIQSISTNGANQDVVSMGTIAARKVRHCLDLTRQIHAILALALAQAMELRAWSGVGADMRVPRPGDLATEPLALAGFSPAARALHALVRRVSPPLDGDRPLGPEITALALALHGDPGKARWRLQAA
jgi:tyrosine ammonia-lyase